MGVESALQLHLHLRGIWVQAQTKSQVCKFLDFANSGEGLLKGESPGNVYSETLSSAHMFRVGYTTKFFWPSCSGISAEYIMINKIQNM